MKLGFGLKAHSGWAALVAIGENDGSLVLATRRRIELIDEPWAKQPYHFAENMEAAAARDVVRRGIASARKIAVRELRAEIRRERGQGHEVVACAVLVGEPMPEWSVAEILSVHIRMHKAEGVLFRDALVRGAQTCGLRTLAIPEKTLAQYAVNALGSTPAGIAGKLVTLGKLAGPPWGTDQKDAALAAMLVLQRSKVRA